MSELETKSEAAKEDFTDELSDEALDRDERISACQCPCATNCGSNSGRCR